MSVPHRLGSMVPDVAPVTRHRSSTGESPVWCALEHALYWVDIPARQVLRLDTVSSCVTSWTMPEQVACLALAGTGEFIAGMESGIFHVTLGVQPEAQATRLAAPRFVMPGMRFNDGRCYRQGRFWAGTLGPTHVADAIGCLYRFDAERGLSAPIVDGLLRQNGLAWSPDGRTMYLSDSHPDRRCIWAFDFDIGSGTPTRRRLFVDMRQHIGRPDGAAIDIDGCYWCAAVDGGCLLRFTPAGQLDRKVTLPVAKPSMCAFGGPNLDVLYVTTIRPREAALDAIDGCVLAFDPRIAGCPEPRFAAALDHS